MPKKVGTIEYSDVSYYCSVDLYGGQRPAALVLNDSASFVASNDFARSRRPVTLIEANWTCARIPLDFVLMWLQCELVAGGSEPIEEVTGNLVLRLFLGQTMVMERPVRSIFCQGDPALEARIAKLEQILDGLIAHMDGLAPEGSYHRLATALSRLGWKPEKPADPRLLTKPLVFRIGADVYVNLLVGESLPIRERVTLRFHFRGVSKRDVL